MSGEGRVSSPKSVAPWTCTCGYINTVPVCVCGRARSPAVDGGGGGVKLPFSCGRCEKRWSGLKTAHCPECHETFTVDANADRHRKGTHSPDTRHCVDPASVGLVLSAKGYWQMPAPESREWPS